MDSITDDEVTMALDVLERFQEHEPDDAHRREIEAVRTMIRGVFGYERALPSDGEVAVLERVLDAIDPDEQRWSDPELVESDRDHGLELAHDGVDHYARVGGD